MVRLPVQHSHFSRFGGQRVHIGSPWYLDADVGERPHHAEFSSLVLVERHEHHDEWRLHLLRIGQPDALTRSVLETFDNHEGGEFGVDPNATVEVTRGQTHPRPPAPFKPNSPP